MQSKASSRPVEIDVKRGKLAVQAGESVIDHLPDLGQRMSDRNTILKSDLTEQRSARFIRPTHFAPHRYCMEEGLMLSKLCPKEIISAAF
jgi:hypothetical protein